MAGEIYTILANAGSAAIVGLMFIVYLYYDSKKKSQTLIIKDNERKDGTDEVARELNSKQETDIQLIGQLLNLHLKSNEESFSVVHNGLNTMNGCMEEYNERLNSLNITVEKLITRIEERMPKK